MRQQRWSMEITYVRTTVCYLYFPHNVDSEFCVVVLNRPLIMNINEHIQEVHVIVAEKTDYKWTWRDNVYIYGSKMHWNSTASKNSPGASPAIQMSDPGDDDGMHSNMPDEDIAAYNVSTTQQWYHRQGSRIRIYYLQKFIFQYVKKKNNARRKLWNPSKLWESNLHCCGYTILFRLRAYVYGQRVSLIMITGHVLGIARVTDYVIDRFTNCRGTSETNELGRWSNNI